MKFSKLSLLLFSIIDLACSQTIYTEDIIEGNKVITKLDINDLPERSISYLWFKVPANMVGINSHVPLMVKKGTNDGPRFLLNSGFHGDEYNGIRVVQDTFHSIDENKLNGTLVAVTYASPGAMAGGRMFYVTNSATGGIVDVNRNFKLSPTPIDIGSLMTDGLWKNLYSNNNFTACVDMHGASAGDSYPNLIYGDVRVEYTNRMFELSGADIVKLEIGNATITGYLEDALNQINVPTISYEIGYGLSIQADQIKRSNEFMKRIMADLKMIPEITDKDSISRYEAAQKKTLALNELHIAKNTLGGIVIPCVSLLDKIEAGQVVAHVINPYGHVIEEIKTKVDGYVMMIIRNPASDPLRNIAFISRVNPDESCKLGGCFVP
ncbi:hypothetical protein AYI70_g4172 [Smittium culicis]|uniref:Succinylglutamate desuccinylase/Aspartoacylase catalytic domain-containing protein n=1 Tax=Smittium culicis TaxID=133412 RepID=A0A1R1X353_9FUNG|nr:hypothetical protein AYI70_g11166 [Smittium culicis]OMJ20333.1 hypothetical protein AYI70_g4172 [Smittium culicis]